MNVEMNMKAAGDASTSGGIYTVSSSDTPFSTKPESSAKQYDYSGRRILSSIKTVLYMALSSYLAELTRQSRFLEVAIQCANCIKVWMLDPTTSLIKDCSIDVQVGQELSGAALSCHLTGFTIEGLSVLGSVTGNQEWNNLAIDISRAAMKHREWHSNDGVIIVGTDGTASENTNIKAMKGLLNIGLMVVYERNRTNEPFCNLVRSYINVQFNALYDLARSQNTYGVDWRGPFVGPYPHAQIAAVDTLVAAIGVND
ncbi:hypothetical protein FRC03_006011 [Tulasnella sp. 419]|nr:hypothetical protein FRC03_006011 [Tulasnella sp. 419]